MSNIYIQEPPTNGKVLLVTSVGDIDIELWPKETPRACRNFVQLCMEGYYDNTIFHRVIKGFIIQGGDPSGTGLGGDSIYGKPFKDEFHSRLRFSRRGLLAMANSGSHDNSSQFFFTLDAAHDLNSKHTIFAKVVGDTIYNMLKLEEVETGPDDRPLYPPKIIKTQVLVNPYNDIVPRDTKKEIPPEGATDGDGSQGTPSKATKNFTLLSFGSDAEEEEEESLKLNKDIKGRSKSSHDLSNDPKLSSQPALDTTALQEIALPTEEGGVTSDEVAVSHPGDGVTSEDEPPKELSRADELNLEAKRLTRELQQGKKASSQMIESEPPEIGDEPLADDIPDDNDMIAQYKGDRVKYKTAKKVLKKGGDREDQTLALLKTFQTKLGALKSLIKVEDGEEVLCEGDGDGEFDASWFTHKLDFASGEASKVIDANIYETDRYSLYDPRNPMNKRKRDTAADAQKQTAKSRR